MSRVIVRHTEAGFLEASAVIDGKEQEPFVVYGPSRSIVVEVKYSERDIGQFNPFMTYTFSDGMLQSLLSEAFDAGRVAEGNIRARAIERLISGGSFS